MTDPTQKEQMNTYRTLIKLTEKNSMGAAPRFFASQPEDFEIFPVEGEDGVWVKASIEYGNDVRAAEWLYNLLTRFEMHLSMKTGTPAKDAPLAESVVLLICEGRMVLATGMEEPS